MPFTYEYARPALTVDCVVFALDGGDLKVLLVQRGQPPFEGRWALPGGFVEVGETVEEAAAREAQEETGLRVEILRLVGVYSEPARDPRGHNVSCAFLARPMPESGRLSAATDATEAGFLDPSTVELAFDHGRIVADALAVPPPVR